MSVYHKIEIPMEITGGDLAFYIKRNPAVFFDMLRDMAGGVGNVPFFVFQGMEDDDHDATIELIEEIAHEMKTIIRRKETEVWLRKLR